MLLWPEQSTDPFKDGAVCQDLISSPHLPAARRELSYLLIYHLCLYLSLSLSLSVFPYLSTAPVPALMENQISRIMSWFSSIFVNLSKNYSQVQHQEKIYKFKSMFPKGTQHQSGKNLNPRMRCIFRWSLWHWIFSIINLDVTDISEMCSRLASGWSRVHVHCLLSAWWFQYEDISELRVSWGWCACARCAGNSFCRPAVNFVNGPACHSWYTASLHTYYIVLTARYSPVDDHSLTQTLRETHFIFFYFSKYILIN